MRKKITSALTGVVMALLVLALALTLFLNVSTLWSVNEIKEGRHVASGYFSAIIGSGSMEPAYSVNDLLILKGGATYEAQDVITYVSSRGGLITHRIAEVTDKGYRTQGDANNIPDGEISGQRALGKVIFALPGVGGVIDGLLSPAGVTLFACVCLLLWVINRMRRDQNDRDKEDAVPVDNPES